jgi:hypothetical protein
MAQSIQRFEPAQNTGRFNAAFNRQTIAVIELKTASNTQCKEVLAVSPVVVNEVIDRAAVMQSCKQLKPVLVWSGHRELYEEKVQPLAAIATYTTLQRANFAGVRNA